MRFLHHPLRLSSLIGLSSEWEEAFSQALTGPPEDRQLAIQPARLTEFMQKLRAAFDTASSAGEQPVLPTSGPVRFHVRAVVERVRPATPVLVQNEIYARARIRTAGQV